MNRSIVVSEKPFVRWVVLGLLLLVPVFYVFYDFHGFPYPSPDAIYSDFIITHFPYSLFIQKQIQLGNGIPLWNPLIYSGVPFFANPLAGLFYPPGWLALIFPLPFGLNLVLGLHILFGGIGLLLYLESENVNKWVATFGALGFELLPKLVAHYGAGHVSLLYALAWTPWLFLVVKRKRYNLEALVLAMIYLADVRWGFYATLWWGGYRIFQLVSTKNRWQIAFYSLRIILTALLLSSPLLVSLFEFTQLSTRVAMRASDVFKYSLPIPRILGVFFPDFGGFHEWVFYPGLVVTIFLFIWLILPKKSKIGYFWFFVIILSFGFSLGDNLPFMKAIAELPFFNIMRVPTRGLFLTSIGILVLAMFALDAILSTPDTYKKKTFFIIFAMAGFYWGVLLGSYFLSGELLPNFAYGALVFSITGGIVLLFTTRKIGQHVALIGLGLLCVIDWGYVDKTLYELRPAEKVLADRVNVLDILESGPRKYRLYSPSYSVPQHLAVTENYELAYGVDPLQLRSYADFFSGASGVPYDSYGVTLPPFEHGDPSLDNNEYSPNAEKLGQLNVLYAISDFQLPGKEWLLIDVIDGVYVYENLQFHPRAWLLNEDKSENFQDVVILEWKPNQLAIKANGPGMLILSEVNYPGWQLFIDGERTDITVVNGLFRGAKLQAGEHEIMFVFRPESLYYGFFFFLLGLSLLLGGRFGPKKFRFKKIT